MTRRTPTDQVIAALDDLELVDMPLAQYIEALEELAGIISTRIEAAEEDLEREADETDGAK